MSLSILFKHFLLYRFVCPIEGIGMLIWWVVDEIINNSDPYYPNQPWWEFTPTSLITIVTQVKHNYYA